MAMGVINFTDTEEAPLDLAQVFIQMAAQVDQPLIVFGLEGEIDGFWMFGHFRRYGQEYRRPARRAESWAGPR